MKDVFGITLSRSPRNRNLLSISKALLLRKTFFVSFYSKSIIKAPEVQKYDTIFVIFHT